MHEMKKRVLYKTELNRNCVISKTKHSMEKLKTVVLLWTVTILGFFWTLCF